MLSAATSRKTSQFRVRMLLDEAANINLIKTQPSRTRPFNIPCDTRKVHPECPCWGPKPQGVTRRSPELELFLGEYLCPRRGPLRHQLRLLRHALCNHRLRDERVSCHFKENNWPCLLPGPPCEPRGSNREAWKTCISLRELDPFLTLKDFSGDINPRDFLILYNETSPLWADVQTPANQWFSCDRSMTLRSHACFRERSNARWARRFRNL